MIVLVGIFLVGGGGVIFFDLGGGGGVDLVLIVRDSIVSDSA